MYLMVCEVVTTKKDTSTKTKETVYFYTIAGKQFVSGPTLQEALEYLVDYKNIINEVYKEEPMESITLISATRCDEHINEETLQQLNYHNINKTIARHRAKLGRT